MNRLPPAVRTLATIALIVPVCLMAQASSSERHLSIKSTIGTTKVRRGNDATWKDARVHMPLKAGDAVRTFVESELELETSEGTIMKVGENSTVEIPAFSTQAAGPTTTGIKILAGSLISDVRKLTSTNSKFEFETPTAVASIRGTRLGINVAGDQTSISVYEGRVFVLPRDSKTGAEVGANQMTVVVKGQKTVKVQAMTDARTGLPATAPAVDTTKRDSTAHRDSLAHKDSTGLFHDSLSHKDTTSTVKPVDSLHSARTGQDSTTASRRIDSTAVVKPLVISVTAPANGILVKPGDAVTVAGTVTAGAAVSISGTAARVTAAGQFSGSYTAPRQAGEYDLSIDAVLGSQTKSVSRAITVGTPQSTGCVLTVISPTDGMRLARPVVPVSGTATPGSEVTVSGMRASVLATGAFSIDIPIADEETEMSVDIEASCNGQTKSVSRMVTYIPDLKLLVTAPTPNQVVSSTRIQLTGTITPAGAAVSCQGTRLAVAGGGAFSGFVTIPDEEGSVDLEFEATLGSLTKTLTQTVIYRKPPDILAPSIQPMSFPAFSKVNRLYFTVTDRTPNDEVTFYRSTDGSVDNETGTPGSRFGVDLEDGYHDYVVYAKDRQGNESPRISAKQVCYMTSTAWSIRMRKPLGSGRSFFLPPDPRDEGFQPRYTVQFSVVNLVNDEPKLLKEVSVTNAATGEVAGEKIILDVDFEFDLALKRGTANAFTVKVKDVNDVEKTSAFSVSIR